MAVLVGLGALFAFLFLAGEQSGPGVDQGRQVQAQENGEAADDEPAELVEVARDEGDERVEAAAADAPPTDEVVGAQVASASLEGIVDLPSGFPPQALVEVHAWPEGETESVPLFLDPKEGLRSFRFDDVVPGKWVLSAKATASESDRIAWGKAETVEVQPGEERSGLRIELREYVIVGTVTDVHGSPIPNLAVGYDWMGTDRQAGSSFRSYSGLSNVSLSYVNSIDPASETVLSYSPLGVSEAIIIPRGSPSVQFDVEPEVDLQQLAELLDSVQPPSTASLGAIGYASPSTEEIEEEIEEAFEEEISFSELGIDWYANAYMSDFVVTDASGVFRIPLPGPGSVSVQAPYQQADESDASYITEQVSVELTLEEPEAEAHFELERAATVRGRVVRSDGVSKGIETFLRPVGGGQGTDNTSADEEGLFRFRGLRAGDYLFYARSGGDRGQDFCCCAEITVGDGEVFVLDDVLTESSGLEGVLVDEVGQPLEGKRVTAYGANNRSLSRDGTTGPDGAFRIRGMYPCEYVLEVRGVELSGEVRIEIPPRGALVGVGTLQAAPPSSEKDG